MALRDWKGACLRSIRLSVTQRQRPGVFSPVFVRSHRLFSSSNSAHSIETKSPVEQSVQEPSFVVPTRPKTHHFVDIPSPALANLTTTKRLAQGVRKLAPGITETYVAYGVCEMLIKECSRQADYATLQDGSGGRHAQKTQSREEIGIGKGWWYEKAGLVPTFNTWAQITFLHMYLLTTRIRCFPASHASSWHQHLIDHFSYLAEDRMMKLHNIQAGMTRKKHLKDLFSQWRGLTAAYDEGLVKGDAVLAAAVWRNIFAGKDEIDLRILGQVVSYMRSVLHTMDVMEDEAVATGDVVFGDPGSEEALVKIRSAMIDQAQEAPPPT